MKPDLQRSIKLAVRSKTLLHGGKIKDALALAKEASNLSPSNADAWLLQAAIYAQQHDYHSVEQCCSQVIKHHPERADAYFNLGLAQQSCGKKEAAMHSYQEAIRLRPEYVAAQVNLATILIDMGQTDEALKLTDTVLQSAPGMLEAVTSKGLAMFHSGHAREAMEWLAEARDRFGDAPALLGTLAKCQVDSDMLDEARALLTRIVSVANQYAPAWAELGRVALKQDQYAEAAGHYQRAVSIQPSREHRFHLAHSLYASGNTDAAYSLYQNLLDDWPDDPVVHNNLGRLFEKTGNIKGAETHFRRAVELQPDSAVPYINIGRMLLGTGRLDEALLEYEHAIELDHDNFEGHYGRGQVLCELDRKQEAIESFRVAIDLKPGLTDAKYYIASLGGSGVNEQDQQDYVAGLFDKYAGKFDDELVSGLKYETPGKLFGIVKSGIPDAVGDYDILDLGCGTGLCGPLFRPLARKLVGIDLSAAMIEKAFEKSVYDELEVADIVDFMRKSSNAYDLVIAGDVFVYIGDLEHVFESANGALRKNGYFAFSTEYYDGSGFRIRGSGRHAHSKAYIKELARLKSFTVLVVNDCDLRLEYGKQVRGVLYLLRKE